jgi:hypothetical protein
MSVGSIALQFMHPCGQQFLQPSLLALHNLIGYAFGSAGLGLNQFLGSLFQSKPLTSDLTESLCFNSASLIAKGEFSMLLQLLDASSQYFLSFLLNSTNSGFRQTASVS